MHAHSRSPLLLAYIVAFAVGLCLVAVRLLALRFRFAALRLLVVRSPTLRLASLWFVRFAHLWHLRCVGSWLRRYELGIPSKLVHFWRLDERW